MRQFISVCSLHKNSIWKLFNDMINFFWGVISSFLINLARIFAITFFLFFFHQEKWISIEYWASNSILVFSISLNRLVLNDSDETQSATIQIAQSQISKIIHIHKPKHQKSMCSKGIDSNKSCKLDSKSHKVVQ